MQILFWHVLQILPPGDVGGVVGGVGTGTGTGVGVFGGRQAVLVATKPAGHWHSYPVAVLMHDAP